MFWRILFVFICIIIEKAISTYIVEQNDRCIAVPNDVMAGREALLIFQEMNSYGPKMYTYQVEVIHIKYIDTESIAKSAYDKWFLFFIYFSSSYPYIHCIYCCQLLLIFLFTTLYIELDKFEQFQGNMLFLISRTLLN